MTVVFNSRVREEHSELGDDFAAFEGGVNDLEVFASEYRTTRLAPRPQLLNRMCRVLAAGHAWRGAELATVIIRTVNQRRLLVAHILLRALMETEAAAVYAAVRVKEAIHRNEWDRIYDDLIPKLVHGNRFMAEQFGSHPSSINVLTMVDTMASHYAELLGADNDAIESPRRVYELLSEFAHPCQGSIHYYAQREGDAVTFARHVQDIDFVVKNGNGTCRLLLLALKKIAELGERPQKDP